MAFRLEGDDEDVIKIKGDASVLYSDVTPMAKQSKKIETYGSHERKRPSFIHTNNMSTEKRRAASQQPSGGVGYSKI